MSTTPGHDALTVTPLPRSFSANACENDRTYALVAPYTAMSGVGWNAAAEEATLEDPSPSVGNHGRQQPFGELRHSSDVDGEHLQFPVQIGVHEYAVGAEARTVDEKVDPKRAILEVVLDPTGGAGIRQIARQHARQHGGLNAVPSTQLVGDRSGLLLAARIEDDRMTRGGGPAGQCEADPTGYAGDERPPCSIPPRSC